MKRMIFFLFLIAFNLSCVVHSPVRGDQVDTNENVVLFDKEVEVARSYIFVEDRMNSSINPDLAWSYYDHAIKMENRHKSKSITVRYNFNGRHVRSVRTVTLKPGASKRIATYNSRRPVSISVLDAHFEEA